MKKTQKISLEAFKAKAKSNNSQLTLSKIAGGVLGACHDVYCHYYGTGHACFYYK